MSVTRTIPLQLGSYFVSASVELSHQFDTWFRISVGLWYLNVIAVTR